MRQVLMKIVSALFPSYIIKKAISTLMNPQVRKLRANEEQILAMAQQEVLDYEGFKVQLYKWGSGTKKILMVHGWEGQAGNFSDVVTALLNEDVTIYAFDAPSHGHSSKGETSIFQFVEVVSILLRKHKVDYIVSHSFGGVATVSALYNNRDITVEKYCLFTTPDRFTERIDDVANMIGLSDGIKKKLLARLQEDLDGDIETFNVSDFVQQVAVDKALIIHDKADRVIPISRARNVHSKWPASDMLEVEGTGHFRILRSSEVITAAVDFLVG